MASNGFIDGLPGGNHNENGMGRTIAVFMRVMVSIV